MKSFIIKQNLTCLTKQVLEREKNLEKKSKRNVFLRKLLRPSLTTSLETTTSWLFVPLTSFFIPPGLGRQFLQVSLLREREREREREEEVCVCVSLLEKSMCCVCACLYMCMSVSLRMWFYLRKVCVVCVCVCVFVCCLCVCVVCVCVWCVCVLLPQQHTQKMICHSVDNFARLSKV